ncbi:MAG: hypothetical protein PVF87_06035 [Acidimicrobiia bacterium]
MTSESAPWAGCQVCGHTDHGYQHHLNEVTVPEFVNESVTRLRELELAGSGIEPLVGDMEGLVAQEDGGRKAWAIWLLKLLEELEEASGAPDIAAEIENFLLGGYSS